MATVQNYTKGIVRRREVANQVDPSAIGAAGAVARGVGDLANTGAQVATVIKQKNDASAVNGAIIARKEATIKQREELKTQYKDNPFDYAESVRKNYQDIDKSFMDGMENEEQRASYQKQIEPFNLSLYEQDVSWQNQRGVTVLAERGEEQIESLKTQAYRQEPLEDIKEDFRITMTTLEDVYSPEELARYSKEQFGEVVKSRIQGKIDTNPYEARKILDSQEYDDDLGVDNIVSLRAKADKAIARDIKAKAEAQKKQQQLSLVQSVRDGDMLIDPNDSDHKQAVETDYASFLEELSPQNMNEAYQAKVEYVNQVGVIPKQLKGEVSAGLNGGSPDQQLQIADMVEKIAINNPRVALQFSEKDRVYAKNLSESINAGISGNRAVEFATKNIFERDTEAYKQRSTAFKEEGQKFSESDFTEFFRDDPDNIPAGMKGEYNTLNRKYYMDGGADAKASHELAVERLKANWAITETGRGNRWMKYAPEAVYDNGAPKEWLNEQLIADVTSQGVIVEDIEKFAESLILEVAPETINQPDPSYLVFQQGDDGIIEPLLSNGKVQVWKPDFESSPMFQKLLKESKGDVNAAMRRAKRMRMGLDVKNTLEKEGIAIPDELGLGRAF